MHKMQKMHKISKNGQFYLFRIRRLWHVKAEKWIEMNKKSKS